jgi:hypothetical protein
MAKDYTKYNVANVGEKLNKSRLVQAIVKDYITKNTPNWEALQTAFPDNLQGNKCVVAKKSDVEKERDFYMDAPFALSDGTEIVTCRQWGKDNILNFIAQAKTLGYSVLVDGEAAEEVEEESPLDAEQIEKFKTEEAEIYADPDYYAEWDAFSLYDDLLEAGDTAWADRILQRIEDRADGASTFESICEKLQERNETERLFVAAKKGEALVEDTSDYTSLANIISKEDKDWALKLYQKAEELAEDFSDLNSIGDALFEELGDKENALRVQRKAMSLIEDKWNKKHFISSLEDLGEIGESLLAEYMDLEDKSVPKMDIPENLFASYELPWGRFVSLRLENGPAFDNTYSFRILLDMKEKKIVGKTNEDRFRRWFDEREVGIYDDFVKLKSYDGVLTISGGDSKETEDWQISCHTDFEEVLDGELPKDASGDDLYNAVGQEKEVYQLYRYLYDNSDEKGIKIGFNEADIAALTKADSSYEFGEALEEALEKEQLDALDYEPLLIEMAKENTLKGQSFHLSITHLAGLVNLHFGNLCHRAYYGEEGITKTNLEYAATWGELVTALAERAKKVDDYINLASCIQMKFTAFEDRVECEQFANENYYRAIEEMDDVTELVGLVGGHLQEEYYENDELTTKAGEKALNLAATFEDYAYICFDDSERCNFRNSDIYKNAVAKAIELKAYAEEDELERFKGMLEEEEDEENLEKLNEVSNETQSLKKVNIKIGGRIPNYLFGVLKGKYYDECETALSFASEDVETIEDMLKLLYGTVLEGATDGIEEFKENMDMDEFKENCPLLADFFESASGSMDHEQFYEIVFDMAWKKDVNIIEDDAYITITVDDEEVVKEQDLADFLGETEWINEEDHPKAAAITQAFWAKHRDRFNLDEDNEFTTYKAKNGVLQFNEWIEPNGLAAYKVRERNVTFEHDNIVKFNFDFKVTEFDLSKLAFLRYANVTDFRHSGAEYVGSFLVYDNNIIRPDIIIYRDKGFTLYYEEGFKSCSFLIEG